MGYIYKITNQVNGKVYIGQTRNDIGIRWQQHKNSSTCPSANDYNVYLHVSMRKYGKNNFFVEKVEECKNEDLNEREIFWINYYQSFNNRYGYNLTLGGSGSQKYTDDEILKLWNEGKTISDIHGESGIDGGWIGVRLKACGVTEDEISHRRYKSTAEKQSIPVYQYKLSGEYIRSFESIKDARRVTGIGHIEKCCAGKQKQAGGFQWSYEKLDYLPSFKNTSMKIIPKEVVQIDVSTGAPIAEYSTIADASRKTGVDVSGIAKVCKGVQNTAGGYAWAYKSDYEQCLLNGLKGVINCVQLCK